MATAQPPIMGPPTWETVTVDKAATVSGESKRPRCSANGQVHARATQEQTYAASWQEAATQHCTSFFLLRRRRFGAGRFGAAALAVGGRRGVAA